MNKNDLIEALRDAANKAVQALEASAKGDDRELRHSLAYLQFFAGRAIDAYVGDNRYRGYEQHEATRALLGMDEKKEVAA